MISKEREAEILRLFHAEKWRIGTIATQLGIHHSTVQRVLGHAGLDPRLVSPRPSILDAYKPFILTTLTKYPNLRASRVYQMIRERGYSGSADHFRHVVARLRPRPAAEAYLRVRTLPGEQAQVDWGHFGRVQIGAALRTLWAFVMVLSWSRQIFLRFYLNAAMPSFLRGHVDAFRFYQGVPRIVHGVEARPAAPTARALREDLERFPDSLSKEVHRRVGPEVPDRTFGAHSRRSLRAERLRGRAKPLAQSRTAMLRAQLACEPPTRTGIARQGRTARQRFSFAPLPQRHGASRSTLLGRAGLRSRSQMGLSAARWAAESARGNGPHACIRRICRP
jgi:transposase